jgi:predicted nucleotidyltransferase
MDKEKADILSRLKDFIKRHRVERAIVFGSAARGEAGEDSDLDVILVSHEFKGKSALKRPVPFYVDWDLGYPVDFLCYTPEEFSDLKKRATIVRVALKEGIEIEV